MKVDFWRRAAPGSWTRTHTFISLYMPHPSLPAHTLRSHPARVHVGRLLANFDAARALLSRRAAPGAEIWHKVFGTCSRETFEYKFNGWGVENVLRVVASPTFHIQITQDCENNKNRDEQFLSADVRRRIQKPAARGPLCVASAVGGPRERGCGFERWQIRRSMGGCRHPQGNWAPPRVIE